MWIIGKYFTCTVTTHLKCAEVFNNNYTVSQKNCTFRYFPNTKKIRNIHFVANFILNKSCEFYYDDVTMTSFIGKNKATSPPNALRNVQHAAIAIKTLQLVLDPY